MKKYVYKAFAMTVFVSLFTCCSPKSSETDSDTILEKSDLENYGLSGKVKSVTTVTYDAYDKFGEGNIQKAKPENIWVEVVSFDSLGNILLEKSIRVDKAKRKYTTISNDHNQWTKFVSYYDNNDTKMQFGTDYYYDDKGNMVKEVDLVDDDVTIFRNTYNNEGQIISQIGGSYKRYWEYENGELVKHIERYYGYNYVREDVFFYKDGVIYKENRGTDVNWTHEYDEQKRKIESNVFRHGNMTKKVKYMYSGKEGDEPIEEIEWNEEGVIEHDYTYTYFKVGNDTVTVIRFDKEKLSEILFYSKDSQGVTKDTYYTTSKLRSSFQYYYEDGILVSRKDWEAGKEYKYDDDILSITTENRNKTTERKYIRNKLISEITKDENGNVTYSNIFDDDENIKTITLLVDGEMYKWEAHYENGKEIRSIDEKGKTSYYSYDERGNLSELKEGDGTIWIYEYDFDPQGNWVRKKGYKDGNLKEITERSIIYYE